MLSDLEPTCLFLKFIDEALIVRSAWFDMARNHFEYCVLSNAVYNDIPQGTAYHHWVDMVTHLIGVTFETFTKKPFHR